MDYLRRERATTRTAYARAARWGVTCEYDGARRATDDAWRRGATPWENTRRCVLAQAPSTPVRWRVFPFSSSPVSSLFLSLFFFFFHFVTRAGSPSPSSSPTRIESKVKWFSTGISRATEKRDGIRQKRGKTGISQCLLRRFHKISRREGFIKRAWRK